MNVVLLALGSAGTVILGLLLGARWMANRAWHCGLTAYRLRFPAGLTHDQVSGWLGVLAAASSRTPVAFEVTATSRGIEHYLLVPQLIRHTVLAGLRSALPGVRVEEVAVEPAERPHFRAACELRLTNTSRPLAAERAIGASSAILESLQPLARGQVIQVCWVVGGTSAKHPAALADLPVDLARARRIKQRDLLVVACGRIAVGGCPRASAWSLVHRLHSAMRVLNAPGVAVTRRRLPSWLVGRRVTRRALPLLTWPAILNTGELAALVGIPLQAAHVPGLALGYARQLPPIAGAPRTGLTLAHSNYPGFSDRPLTLTAADRLRHLWLLGPTGTGKSTLIANMALQCATADDGLVVVDPKADLCADILARLPAERHDDIILLDPSSRDAVVGFNILGAGGDDLQRELVVDNVVAIFADIWRGALGPRSTDVLRNSLLTLTSTRAVDGSVFTLTEVAPLLERKTFRRFVTSQSNVPKTVRSFWIGFEALSDRDAAGIVGPLLNKLRALTTRSPLRLMLGQSAGLDMAEVLRERRILLLPLHKGLIGSETAALLGSLAVSSLWNSVLQRSSLPPGERRPVWAFLDEFQDVLRLSGGLSDALSQARALGLGFVLAHQYLDQLPRPMQAAVLGTVRSSVVFQLDHDDAAVLEHRFAPALTRADLMGLDAYEVAMRLCVRGQTRAPVTGITRPLPPVLHNDQALVRASSLRLGRTRADIETAIRARLAVGGGGDQTRFGRHRSNA